MSDSNTSAVPRPSLLTISIACGTLLLLHLLLRFYYGSIKDGLDSIALGLAVVGISPWIASIVATLKFGGVELSFVQAKVEKQGLEIEQLRFLITNYLPEWELQHLRNLVNNTKFVENLDEVSDQFEDELRHLRGLKFIEHRTDVHGYVTIKNFFTQGDRVKDVSKYFRATDAGRKFMEHYDSSVKALNASPTSR